MKCDDVKEYFYDYITSSLDAAMQIKIEHHVKECPNCNNALKELQNTIRLLDTLKPPKLDPDSNKRIMRRIAEESQRRSELNFSRKARGHDIQYSMARDRELYIPPPKKTQKKYILISITFAVTTAILFAIILALKHC